MKATLALFGVTLSSCVMKFAHLLNDYPGTFTSIAGCFTIAAALHTMMRKDKR